MSVSPTRTYVAMCSKPKFNGYYFKKFTIPEDYPNNSREAAWYFLNKLDHFSCIEGCIAFEDYSNITE